MRKYLAIVRGISDYFFRKDLFIDSNQGFNGQTERQRIFLSLIKSMNFDFIVETGTFRGVTTEFMARHSSTKILTVEQHPRYYGFSLARHFFLKNIRRYLMDTVKFLKEVLPKSVRSNQFIFFYLDAHWETHLPLREELQFIFASYPKSIVMIDDFKVPDDEGYRYDDYGQGMVIDLDYVSQSRLPPIQVYFPKAASGVETGSKRGCAVICHAQELSLAKVLASNAHLRLAK